MGAEIYIRRPSIKGRYSEDNIETNDALEMFLQQIEMTLSTPPTSVLGSTPYGVSLNHYLHNLSTSSDDLKRVVNEQISLNCSLASQFAYTIEVEYYKVGQSDAAIIDIVVEKDNLVRIVAN